MTEKPSTDTLYYDSDCPICSAEMTKLERLKHDSLVLVPIKHAKLSEPEKQKLYDSLHIKKANGQILRGYDANIYAWQQTKYRRLAQLFNLPPFSWLGKIAYTLWLQYYQWRRKSTTNERGSH